MGCNQWPVIKARSNDVHQFRPWLATLTLLFILLPQHAFAQRVIIIFRDSTTVQTKIDYIGKKRLHTRKASYNFSTIARINYLDSLNKGHIALFPVLKENGIVVEFKGKVMDLASISETVEDHRVYQKPRTGEVRVRLGLPWFNHIASKNATRLGRFGFFGESVGLEYSYCDKRFMEIEYDLVAASPTFFPPRDVREYFTWGFALSHHHLIGRVSVGYGLSYTHYEYVETDSQGSQSAGLHSSAGAILKGFYRMGRTLHIGVVYRPTFYRTDIEPAWTYEHSLSIEFAWRFVIRRKGGG